MQVLGTPVVVGVAVAVPVGVDVGLPVGVEVPVGVAVGLPVGVEVERLKVKRQEAGAGVCVGTAWARGRLEGTLGATGCCLSW